MNRPNVNSNVKILSSAAGENRDTANAGQAIVRRMRLTSRRLFQGTEAFPRHAPVASQPIPFAFVAEARAARPTGKFGLIVRVSREEQFVRLAMLIDDDVDRVPALDGFEEIHV